MTTPTHKITYSTQLISALIVACVLIVLIAIGNQSLAYGVEPTNAQGENSSLDSSLIDPSDKYTYIHDEYSLLTQEDYEELNKIAQDCASKYNQAIYLVVVSDTENHPIRMWAEDYWNSHGLGIGERENGIMFVLAVESRQIVTITHGSCIDAFCDRTINDMEDQLVDILQNDNFVSASKHYVHFANRVMKYYSLHGEPLPTATGIYNRTYQILIALALALAVAWLILNSMKKVMTSARPQEEADKYQIQNTFRLVNHSDTFIRSAVTKTPIPKDTNNSSGGFGGGGSSVSSSGFGGSSGRSF